MTVTDAARCELDRLPEPIRSSVLAASARTLAERLDEASTRDAPALARELRATVGELRELAKAAPKEADPLDEISARRAARLAGAQASKRATGTDNRRARGGRPRGKRRADPGSGAG